MNRAGLKLLALMEGRNYYHGSIRRLNRIDPRPSQIIGGDSAVFATDCSLLACIFIPKWGDSDLSVGYINDRLYVGEKYPGALDLLNVAGYLHTVSSDGFIHDPRCGMRNEYICKESVDVTEIRIIACVLHDLREAGVWIIEHDEFARDYADLL